MSLVQQFQNQMNQNRQQQQLVVDAQADQVNALDQDLAKVEESKQASSNESCQTPQHRVRGAFNRDPEDPKDCLSAGSGESGNHPKSAVLRHISGDVRMVDDNASVPEERKIAAVHHMAVIHENNNN